MKCKAYNGLHVWNSSYWNRYLCSPSSVNHSLWGFLHSRVCTDFWEHIFLFWVLVRFELMIHISHQQGNRHFPAVLLDSLCSSVVKCKAQIITFWDGFNPNPQRKWNTYTYACARHVCVCSPHSLIFTKLLWQWKGTEFELFTL